VIGIEDIRAAAPRLEGVADRTPVVSVFLWEPRPGCRVTTRLLRTSSTIVMPADAPSTKLEATHRYGAEVITYNGHSEDRERIGLQMPDSAVLPLAGPLELLVAPLSGAV
jgi:threonine dehydratase